MNALEDQAVHLTESPRVTNFNWSESGQSFFINDVGTMHNSRYLKLLFGERDRVRRARFIVISVEDQKATYADEWRIPARSEAIEVRRGTLNLVASRFQNLNRRARTLGRKHAVYGAHTRS